VSVHTPALHPAIKSAPATSARLSLISPSAAPEHIRSIPLASDAPRSILPASAPAQPPHVTLIVSRLDGAPQHGTCALCWSGPGELVGSVHRRGTHDLNKGVCSRCLVTLEMLAVQFEPELRLQIETPV
jgi:hypothetical protein